MHLSRRSRAILLASQLKADQTIEELAESTRIPPHTLRRELNSLRERGLIVRLPFVDVFRLGFVESQLFFSVAPDKSEGSVAGLVRLLRKSWRVPWLATLGGTYQYGVTILGKDVSDTVEFLDSISPTHRAMLQDKVVNTLVSFRYLLKRHLIEEPESVPLDWVGVSMSRADGGRGRKADRPSEATVATDSLDRRILAELFRASDRSNKELSEALGVTRSTFEYRLRRLMDERILVGFINVVPPTRLGMSTFKIIVSLRLFDSSVWDDLIRFSEENPNIVNIIHCIGKWDYELGVEVNNPNEAFQISQKLSLFLGERLGSLSVIPVFQQIVPTNFLGMD